LARFSLKFEFDENVRGSNENIIPEIVVAYQPCCCFEVIFCGESSYRHTSRIGSFLIPRPVGRARDFSQMPRVVG
jgi:hypothetical protein